MQVEFILEYDIVRFTVSNQLFFLQVNLIAYCQIYSNLSNCYTKEGTNIFFFKDTALFDFLLKC